MSLFDKVSGRLIDGALQASLTAGAVPTATKLLEQGLALDQLGQMDAALQHYTAALELQPDLARAHFNRGNILLDRDDAPGALQAYLLAARYKPDSAGTHFNLGAAYARLDRRDDAIAAYRQAITLRPDFAQAHLALAHALEELGHDSEAVDSYRQTLRTQADDTQAMDKLARLLKKLGRLDEAVACYRQWITLCPDDPRLYSELAILLLSLERLDEALEICHRALEIDSGFASAYWTLGDIHMVRRMPHAAAFAYRRYIEIEADNAIVHNNLAQALKDLGRLDEALPVQQRAVALGSNFFVAHSNLLLLEHYLPEPAPQRQFDNARRFGEQVASLAPASRPPFQNRVDAERELCIGFISADFNAHPVGYFVEGMLAALRIQASGRLRLCAYSTSSTADQVTQRIARHFHHWHSAAHESDASLAQHIREDRVDILFDLSGHTAKNRLSVFALKPAPVQISWLGYFATTGVEAIDYLIADPWTLPSTEERYFTEKIFRLPETRLCFTPPEFDLDTAPLPALANGHVTFGCFNARSKINRAVIDLWARTLHAIPNSRLHLMTPQFYEDCVARELIEEFGAVGIADDRLDLQKPVPRSQYLASYQRVDMMLDTFPFPGGTTTAEALWMGVPVLTLAGKSFLSRQGVGLLMNAGLPQWIAESPDDYVDRAVSWADDLPRLAALRSGLRKQVLDSPLFDAPRFAGHFERALRQIWREWCTQANKGCGHEE